MSVFIGHCHYKTDSRPLKTDISVKKSDKRTLKSDNRTNGHGSKEPLSCPISIALFLFQILYFYTKKEYHTV